ncbi:MAG: aspartate aminotransferase family protein [Lachnospiraceae bacterium]|nr:aspartate aminotransferase family protein [Lachnospiraceae bacterium]
MNKTIEKAEQNLLHTYNRFQLVIDHGEGNCIFDTDGKEYLDFFSGIGVFGLGYGNKKFADAVKAQVDKITHVSNYFYTEPLAEAAAKLTEVSQMDKVFFTNSGAEAVEGALKAALKYAYNKDKSNDHEIIAMDHSFHGRTCGALAVTGKAAYREAFEPLISKVNFANINDFESVERLVNDKTCAIIMETVQGEGGIYPADEDFLRKVSTLCKEKDIVFILDEVQCGMGRTGYMFAWQKYGIKPDIMTCAKALGNGIPVGAFLLSGRVAESSLVAGDHGTTYGGNPLASTAVSTVLDIFREEEIDRHVREITPYLESRLDELKDRHSCVLGRRGAGFMQGLILSVKPGDVVNKGLEKGIILLTAGTDVLRLLPPLTIGKEEIDKMYEILDSILAEFDQI